jgi:hypothetical protein
MLVMGTPGERRLDKPPSERYRVAANPEPAARGSTARAIGAGAGAAGAWAILTVLFGGILLITAGLLVLAGAAGRVIALAVAWGGGPGLAARTRMALVIGLVVAGFVLGQLGLWAYARSEGGVLALVDYLVTTFGIVVPLQLAIALAVGWWTAR